MVRRRFERFLAPLSDLSLTAKSVLVVAIPVVALLTAMAVFHLLSQQIETAQDWVEHTFQVRAEIERAANLLARAGTAEGSRTALREIQAPIAELVELTRDNPAQARRAQDLQALVLTAGAQPGGFRGEMAERLDTALQTMREAEDSLLSQRAEGERKARTQLEIAILAGGGLGLLGGLVAALVLGAGIVRRVRRLESDARRMAAGAPVLGEISGGDELARLARTLRETSEMLAAQQIQLRAAHAEMEGRVQLRTRELTIAIEELRQSTEVRDAIFLASPLAIWGLDVHGMVTFWSPAAEQTFGFGQDEVSGRTAPIVPPDQAEEYDRSLEVFRRGGAIFAGESVRQRKDGKRIDVLTWTAPLRDAEGQVTGTLVIDSDVTDRRLLEEQFRQSQKLEAVGQLAGGVAHDFNNLLTVILGYVQMLRDGVSGDPELVECTDEIHESASRAGALTAQLLAFSRRQVSQPQVLSLNDAVNRSLRMLRRVIGEDIEVTTHLDPAIGKVKADPTHVDQLIMNLVVNARDAMARGGRITIDTANLNLDEHYGQRHIGVPPGAYAMLAVSDTGAGMPPEVRSRLFEPFFTTKEPGKGTGLGLSIVYGIVKQSGGEIMVYSEPGQGTTFKIYLPVTEGEASGAAAEGRIQELRGTETILLCEDEAAIRKLVRSMLSKNGYQVLEAETPQRAMEICRQYTEPIELLLTDIVMPRTSGFELARNVVAMRPATKILYMSGYTDSRLSASWVFDPSTPFLQKPFTVTLLVQKVREALGASDRAKPVVREIVR